MLIINYLISLLVFAAIFFLEKLFLFWKNKKPIWPFLNFNLLIDAITYSALSLLLMVSFYIIFKKIDDIGLIWFDVSLYLIIRLIKPSQIFFAFRQKEKLNINQKGLLGASFFIALMLECFLFNSAAYDSRKQTYGFDNFVCESIQSEGTISENKIILANKQNIIINTNNNDYDNIYIGFDNGDMNLYVNIYARYFDDSEYKFVDFALIDPKIDSFGYISLDNMEQIQSLKIEFDIDDSRYMNSESKPLIHITKIEFDSYFPLLINPLRLTAMYLCLGLVFSFKKIFIKNIPNESSTIFDKIEKNILFIGGASLIIFIIYTLINNAAYFIKYDELYLGGYESSNIYYQQFAAYVKGQLHIDGPVSEELLTVENPYNPYTRDNSLVLWDHAFYKGKYYSYYGHAPIYLVMLPIYFISGFVPSNKFIVQLGVIFSIFAFLIAVIQIFKLFIKKTNTFFVALLLVAMVLGSFLLGNNTYEYGGMIYRIPYAYANGFLFLTTYFFLKGYQNEKNRYLYFIFTALSLVFIVLSRPLEIIYLITFIPLIIKMVISDKNSLKQKIINYVPTIGIVLIGAIFVCTLNYLRFENIFEFGEHYQLTVTDCTKNTLTLDGVLPTLYHFFIQKPKFFKKEGILGLDYVVKNFEIHPYVMPSVGMLFVPIAALCLLVPYVIRKEDDISLKIFLISSPIIILLVAFINYCFAGICPRYLNDIAPWMALVGGLVALKAIELNDGKKPIVPIFIAIILIATIVIVPQYHFVQFDGFKVGDFGGLYSYYKTIFNNFNLR